MTLFALLLGCQICFAEIQRELEQKKEVEETITQIWFDSQPQDSLFHPHADSPQASLMAET